MSNVQPLVVETLRGHIAVAHNGELYNAKALKDKVISDLISPLNFSTLRLMIKHNRFGYFTSILFSQTSTVQNIDNKLI